MNNDLFREKKREKGSDEKKDQVDDAERDAKHKEALKILGLHKYAFESYT